MRLKNGISLLERDSGGSLIIASYHPIDCPYWHWCFTLRKINRNSGETRSFFRAYKAAVRTNQWHDYYDVLWLPFIISRQDYHLQKTPTHSHGELQ